MVAFCATFAVYFISCWGTFAAFPQFTEQQQQDRQRIEPIDGEIVVQTSDHITKEQISMMVAVSKTNNDSQICFPPVTTVAGIVHGCFSKIEYDFQIDRIPQVLPQIRCRSLLPSWTIYKRHMRMTCEEVKYLIPVMYLTGQHGQTSQFESIFNNVSVGCIKSVAAFPQSLVLEKKSKSLVLERFQ